MSERYALYFTPAADSVLYQLGSSWLQYDAYTGQTVECANTLPCDKEIVSVASRYGFHATLKAPFQLKEGKTRQQLIEAIEYFCADKQAFELGQLQITKIGRFLALALETPNPKLTKFVQQCLETFEPFRAAMTEIEYQKRDPYKLSSRQQENLNKWGYPYVEDEYRFHLTLTDKLLDEQLGSLKKELHEAFIPVLQNNLKFNYVHLFHQMDVSSRFRIIESFVIS